MAKRLMVPLALAGALAALAAAPAAAKAKSCSELASLALPGGKVTAATLVEAGKFSSGPPGAPPPPGVGPGTYGNLPAFCRVQATMTPTSDSDIKVEVWLPASGWNGKFVGIGNGIWAGQLSLSQLGEPLSRGYAAATTDTGHSGSGLTADFAIGHPEKLIDFGYRAVHEMTVTAKTVIKAFYGKKPQASFWNSCSTGGRQGLMAAYRYPKDYDVISAMAPANPMTKLMTQTMWAGWMPNRGAGAAVPVPKLALVHRAVLAQCDKLDGAEDGIVGRPEACSFDPGKLQCTGADGADCLTASQVETVRGYYGGVRDPRTNAVLAPGWPASSEIQLATLTQAPTPFPVALTYFSMLVFGEDKGWDWKTFDYARDLEAGRRYGAGILDVSPDGLRPFFARGGKLLLSHGWGDGLIPATNTLDFNTGLTASIPARQRASQYRLFMVPGMDHCGGGEGASQIDTLAALDAWYTTKKAPDTLIARRPAADGGPGAAPRPALSRPLCPWPKYAKYNGTGDMNDAASFTCTTPS